jgi:S-adenosylmethionine:tRNA ribosyltransferase-isomerase
VAAPTAGLHFTPGLLQSLTDLGVAKTQVTLHVGTGTFRSVETEFVEQHPMHHEWCRMSPEAIAEVKQTRAGGGRVIAVGTTATRTIESVARGLREGRVVDGWLSTNILITPGYAWEWTDGLFTNFHLPCSTLMAMVGAFLEPSGGVERLKELYAIAIERRYRFYSFGDAMLVLP